ncbi:MAG: hypothetical protein K0R66_1447 [Gammaproteobacteria bacterium]|jgi:hypothetical protein|nr:hypothetical protein [Gammaproteobacteria bacterium]
MKTVLLGFARISALNRSVNYIRHALVDAQLMQAEKLYQNFDVGPCRRLCEEIVKKHVYIKPQEMSQELSEALSDVYYFYGLTMRSRDRDQAVKLQDDALKLNPNNKKAQEEKELVGPYKYPVIWPENQTEEERKFTGWSGYNLLAPE